MAEDGVLAAVVEIDEAPDLARAGGRGGNFLQLHLREIVDVVAGEGARRARWCRRWAPSSFGMMMRGSGSPLASTTMKPCAMKLLRNASATPEMRVGLVSAFWMAK